MERSIQVRSREKAVGNILNFQLYNPIFHYSFFVGGFHIVAHFDVERTEAEIKLQNFASRKIYQSCFIQKAIQGQ